MGRIYVPTTATIIGAGLLSATGSIAAAVGVGKHVSSILQLMPDSTKLTTSSLWMGIERNKKAPAVRRALLQMALEVDDYVGSELNHLFFVARDAELGIAIEGGRAEGRPIGDFGAEPDLRRQPMLPANRGIEILRGTASARAPSIGIVVPFQAERIVVQGIG